MDLLEHLMQEHRRAEHMMQRLSESEPGQERERLVDELDDALSTHMLVEEQFLYPLVAKVIGGETREEAEVEHSLTRDGLMKLQDLSREPGFVAATEMLQAGVAHHVKEEEEEVFPELRQKAPDEIAAMEPEQLEAQVRDEEQTRDELYERARAAGIRGRSAMTKHELAEAVHRASA